MGEGGIVCILAGVPRGAHFGWMGGGGELLGWMQLAGVLLSAVGGQVGTLLCSTLTNSQQSWSICPVPSVRAGWRGRI